MKTFLFLPCLAGVFCATVAAGAEAPSSGGIAQALQPFVDSHSLSGAVILVADKDKILDLEAVGYADIAAQKPMRVDSYFWIASMTKSFTATAVMMLVDERKLSVDDPLEKYLPEFKDQMVVDPKDPAHTAKKASHPIKIRELLSHTSGIPFHPAVKVPKDDSLPLAALVKYYAAGPLVSDPGSTYAYSNAGFNTLGRVIEVVSGQPYGQFVQDRILTPLGMTETTFVPTEAEVARLAKVYQPNAAKTGLEEIDGLKSGFTYPLSDPKRFAMPSGGLFSTAADTAKFCEMYLNNGVYLGKRYLSAESIKQMTTKQTSPAERDGYGFGWDTNPNGIYFHGGGYKTYMEIDPKRGRLLVYMMQYFGHDWPNNGSEIMHTYRDAAAKVPASPTVAK